VANNPLLPGVTVPGPSSPGVESWLFEGLGGLHTQDQFGYDAFTDEYFANKLRDEVLELPLLPEIVVPGVTPPAFQGPLPDPLPDATGGGGSTTTPTTTTSSEPARSPYSVPKASKLRTLRFVLEELVKRIAPGLRNVIPRMPTPMTFLADALLIGDEVADATLFKPGDLPRIYPVLDEVVIPSFKPIQFPQPLPIEVPQWSPFTTPSPIPNAMPNPLPVAIPVELPITSPSPAPLPIPFGIPIPSALPLPLETPFDEPLVTVPSGMPYLPLLPSIDVPLVGPISRPSTPIPSIDFTPSYGLGLDDAPGFVPAADPAPAPAPLAAGGAVCPPCTKKTESKTKTRRQKCFIKLVREKSDPSKDRSTNWRMIKCQ